MRRIAGPATALRLAWLDPIGLVTAPTPRGDALLPVDGAPADIARLLSIGGQFRALTSRWLEEYRMGRTFGIVEAPRTRCPEAGAPDVARGRAAGPRRRSHIARTAA